MVIVTGAYEIAGLSTIDTWLAHERALMRFS